MDLRQRYAILFVSDLARAEIWYTGLLGRGPDFRPMDSLVQWEFDGAGGLQVTTNPFLAGEDARVGKGAISLVVGDFDETKARLAAHGLAVSDETRGDYSRMVQLRDADGNLVTLATPPDPAYPRA